MKKRIVALLMIFTLIVSMVPANFVYAKETSTTDVSAHTYNELRQSIDNILEKVVALPKIEQQVAISILKNSLTNTEDQWGNKLDNEGALEEPNGLSDGIDQLIDLTLELEDGSGSILGESLSSRIREGLEARNITLEKAARAVKILDVFEEEYRGSIVDSLRTDQPISFFASKQEEKDFSEELVKIMPRINALLEADGSSIDEFSFFAFLAKAALDQPIFIDDLNGVGVRFTNDTALTSVKDKIDIALLGLKINNREFKEGTVETIFSSFESSLNEAIKGNEAVAKRLLSEYGLYASKSPKIQIKPVYKLVDSEENTTVSFDVIMDRFAIMNNLHSIEFDINYDAYEGKNGSLVYSSMIHKDLVDYIKTSEDTTGSLMSVVSNQVDKKLLTYTLTGLGELDSPTSKPLVIGSFSFTADNLGQVGLAIEDLVLADNNNEEIPVDNVEMYKALVDIKSLSTEQVDIFAKVDGRNFDENNSLRVGKENATLKGTVYPKSLDVLVKLNDEDVIGEKDDTTGIFKFNLENLSIGENNVTVTAGAQVNEYTIIYDDTMPDGTLSIEDGAPYTNTEDVKVTLAATNTNEVKVSNTNNFDNAEMTILDGTELSLDWTLPSGEGEKTVYAELTYNENDVEKTNIIKDTIILDQKNPVIGESRHSGYDGLRSGDEVSFIVEATDDNALSMETSRILLNKKLNNGEEVTEEISVKRIKSGFYGTYIIPENSEFTITGMTIKALDKAGNESEKTVDFANPIEFRSQLTVEYSFEGAPSNETAVIRLENSETNRTYYRWIYGGQGNKATFYYLSPGNYSVTVDPIYDNSYITYVDEALQVKSGVDQTETVEVKRRPEGTLNLTLESDENNPIEDANVYINSMSSPYHWDRGESDANGKITFDNIPLNDEGKKTVRLNIYAQGYANKTVQDIVVEESTNETVTLPVASNIRGVVKDESGNPLQNVNISAYSSGSWASDKTNVDGEYRLQGLKDDVDYRVTVNPFNAADGQKYLSMNKTLKSKKSEDFDESYDFELEVAKTLEGNVISSTGDEIESGYISLQPVNGNTYGWARIENGNYEMGGLAPGDYRLNVYYVSNHKNYTDTITINDSRREDLTILVRGGSEAFTGDANLLKSDKNFVAPQGYVTYTAKYENTNVAAINDVDVNIELPEGFEVVSKPDGAGEAIVDGQNVVTKTHNSMASGESGTFTITAKAPDEMLYGQEYSVKASADWSLDGNDYSEVFGAKTVEALSATFNAVDRTNVQKVRVYGETSPNAEIQVYQVMPGEDKLVSVVAAQGRLWSTNIELPATEGEYEYYVKSELNGQVSSPTEPLTINYNKSLLAMESAVLEAGWNGRVETNPEVGVVTLGVSQGEEIETEIKIPDNGDVSVKESSVKILFNDEEYSSTLNGDLFESSLRLDYLISGTKEMSVVFEDSLDRLYHVPLANIIVLIDPSGYIYDAVEGEDERVEGLTATLEYFDDKNNDDKKDDGENFKFWNASIHGQVNPQTTNEEGRYGWDVPGGDDEKEHYKVVISDDANKYATYNTGLESKWVDDEIGISVLPARFDVNIGVVNQNAPTVEKRLPNKDATNVGFKDSIEIEFDKKMNEDTIGSDSFTLQNTDTGENIEGTVAYDSETRTASFTPSEELDVKTSYTVVLSTDIESDHGITSNDAKYSDYLDEYNKPLAKVETYSFTTGEVLDSTNPANGATDVSISENITITFGKSMDKAVLESSTNVSLKKATEAITATLAYDDTNKTLTINPEANLDYSSDYVVSLTGIKTADDQSVGDIEITFTTEAKPPSEPSDNGGSSSGSSSSVDKDDDEDEVDNKSTFGTFATVRSFLEDALSISIDENTFENSSIITVEKVMVDTPESSTPLETYQMVSEAYDLQLSEKNQKPIKVTFKYDASKVSNEDYLSIFYFNEETKQWEFVGGTINKEAKTVTAYLDHFSTYAVMEFNKTFMDINNHWAQETIELMASKNFVKGIDANQFKPNDTTTRGEFVTMMVRLLDLELLETESIFEDVDNSDWFRKQVMTAYSNGLVKGIGNGKFAPNEKITREQLAVMAMNAYEYKMNETGTLKAIDFTDINQISMWARQSVYRAGSLGLIEGFPNGEYKPQGSATRSESTVIMKRLLEVLGEL